ncbi:MAG: hypothetical protein IJ521_01500, partial [Schwartzia sp.]|nr:hypothetical protein [Schwartzia sp. (in: firmicutes)]
DATPSRHLPCLTKKSLGRATTWLIRRFLKKNQARIFLSACECRRALKFQHDGLEKYIKSELHRQE